jgi:hypothetical protein
MFNSTGIRPHSFKPDPKLSSEFEKHKRDMIQLVQIHNHGVKPISVSKNKK